MTEPARQAAESVARASYGRLVALVASRTRDIAAAEDALAEAFHAALIAWPQQGVPDRPEAWLLTVARRSFGRTLRHAEVRQAASPTLTLIAEEAAVIEPAAFADQRLKLLFVCAHPAIDPSVRTPLMLQTVLGLSAERIAAAFLTPPATMSQRLVRAKIKIRDAGIRFEEPDIKDLPERLSAVLSAIYAAYGSGWDMGLDTGLATEALFLGRLVVDLQPDQPEAQGLLALMLYCEARRHARRLDGLYVPLADQDPALWSREMIVEAERRLTAASSFGTFGRFQAEAAIQSVHCQRAITGVLNLQALATLYDLLMERSPSLGAAISRAAVYGELSGAPEGLNLLDALEPERVKAHQPYWAVRAHLLKAAGRHGEAAQALQRAIGLSDDPAVRAYLSSRG